MHLVSVKINFFKSGTNFKIFWRIWVIKIYLRLSSFKFWFLRGKNLKHLFLSAFQFEMYVKNSLKTRKIVIYFVKVNY